MKQIDNFLIPPYFDKLKELVYSPNFNWFYQSSSLSNLEKCDNFMFTHKLWDLKDGNNSNYFQNFGISFYI